MVRSNLMGCHGEVLKGWTVYTAIAAPAVENLTQLYEKIGKRKYMPCDQCLTFSICKSTDLGML